MQKDKHIRVINTIFDCMVFTLLSNVYVTYFCSFKSVIPNVGGTVTLWAFLILRRVFLL